MYRFPSAAREQLKHLLCTLLTVCMSSCRQTSGTQREVQKYQQCHCRSRRRARPLRLRHVNRERSDENDLRIQSLPLQVENRTNSSKSHPGDAEHVSIVEPSIAPHTKQRTVTARYKGLIAYCPNFRCKQGKLKTTVHTSPFSVIPDTPESKTNTSGSEFTFTWKRKNTP